MTGEKIGSARRENLGKSTKCGQEDAPSKVTHSRMSVGSNVAFWSWYDAKLSDVRAKRLKQQRNKSANEGDSKKGGL